jgi:receptor protein-tyrosine kinase
MSIIEQALNKLSHPEPQTAKIEPQDNAVTAEPENLIEKAMHTAEVAAAAAATAQTQTKTQPKPVAPEKTTGSAQPVQAVSRTKLKQMGIMTPDGERSQLAEEFRLIKRPLLMNALGQGAAPVRNGNLIMVTSSLPGEGKSFCAINLAISIAMEMDHTVLLVDADVAKPRLMNYLGLHSELGLLDVLRDEKLALADVLIKTDIEKLTVLPAGRTYRHATELLASEAMVRFILDIEHRYPDRIIIFDSPPLLATSEASVLATHMGQIVMVVEADRTPQEAVKEALSHIESCEVIGMLLNKAPTPPGGDFYSYGNYGYGGYGS